MKYYKSNIVDSIQSKTSYFASDKHKIYIDINEDIDDPRGDCCAYFHEWGHYIDYVTGKEGGQNEHTRLSTADSKFGELLRTDFNNYIQNYMKKNKIIEEETHRQITDNLCAKMNANNQISDLFNMLSGGKINSRFGHKIDKLSMDERTMFINKEAFAHMFGAQFNLEKRVLLQKFFPKSYTYFRALLQKI